MAHVVTLTEGRRVIPPMIPAMAEIGSVVAGQTPVTAAPVIGQSQSTVTLMKRVTADKLPLKKNMLGVVVAVGVV